MKTTRSLGIKNPLEKIFKNKVINDLKKVDDLYFFVKEAAAIRGIPDIIGCYKGKFFAWELKRSEKESRSSGRAALQKYTIGLVRKAGGIGEFVYPENYKEKFNELISLK